MSGAVRGPVDSGNVHDPLVRQLAQLRTAMGALAHPPAGAGGGGRWRPGARQRLGTDLRLQLRVGHRHLLGVDADATVLLLADPADGLVRLVAPARMLAVLAQMTRVRRDAVAAKVAGADTAGGGRS